MDDYGLSVNVRRRRFLKFFPAAAAASLTVSASDSSFEIPQDQMERRLPVAWCPMEETKAATDDQEAWRLFDAYHLPSGDATFPGDSATINIHGVFPNPALWEYTEWRGLQLEVVYDRYNDLRQIAWCCENRVVPNIGSALQLRVPILESQGLCLTATLRDEEDRRHRFELQFSNDPRLHLAGLRQGMYIAALTPGTELKWSEVIINIEAYRLNKQVLLSSRYSADHPIEFPYMAFTVRSPQLETL
jgi:hypothetical protein